MTTPPLDVETPPAVRDQFEAQRPYLPGSFWLVDGHRYWIDPAGHPVRTSDGHRPQASWINDSAAHEVKRLQLVLA